MCGKRWIWVILGLALAARLGLVAISHVVSHEDGLHPAMRSDAAAYFRMADLFSQGLGRIGEGPHNRDRGWPFLLSLVFRVTGPSPLAAQLTSVAFAMVSVWLVYRLAVRFLDEKWALMAVGLWAFDPAFVGQSSLNLTETPAIAMALGALNVLMVARDRGSIWLTLVSASCLAMAFWTRASTIVLAPAVVLWILGWGVGWGRRLALGGLYGLVMVGAWMGASWVTYRLYGVFTPNTQSYLLFDHSAAKIMVRRGEAGDFREAIDARERRVMATLPAGASLREILEAKKASARAYVMEHPWIQARHQAQAVVATAFLPDRWSVPRLVGRPTTGGIWHGVGGFLEKARRALESWGVVAILHSGLHLALTAVFWLGTMLAAPQLFRGRHRAMAWLLFLCVGAVLVGGAMSVVAVPRYRMPAEPLMALLTAMALSVWCERGEGEGGVFTGA